MTQEQNKPVRSREDQANLILNISEAFALNQEAPTTEFVLGQLEEAEARGAAEQRRKDAEGCERWEFEEPEFHAQGMGCGLEDRGIHDRYQAMEYGWDQAVERCIECIPEELYTHPANVAALEARIAKLEDQERKDAEVIHWLAEKLKETDPKAKADYELLARASLTREGGV